MIQGIIDILKNDAGVQGVVGLNKATNKYKVYPVSCPQPEDDPYIVLSITGSDIVLGKNCDTALDYVKFDVYQYGKTYEKADQLHNAVRNAIHNYSGDRVGYTYWIINLTDYRDGWNSDANLYVRVSSYQASVKLIIAT